MVQLSDPNWPECVACRRKTNPKERDGFVEMYGWSRYRGATGGTNALKWKRSTGRVLCKDCGWDKEQGITGQTQLF